MRNTLYPKTYATIIEITCRCKRDNGVTKDFTPEEWQKAQFHPGKRRFYLVDRFIELQLDNGLTITMSQDEISYQGKKKNHVGKKVKLYAHPKSRRLCYKLTGE
jgi:hypothetical protein